MGNKKFGFRNYHPIRNPNKVNDSFNFFISNDDSVIYKQNNHSDQTFSKLLKNQENYDAFEKILNGTLFTLSMAKHVCKGFDLESDGSYKMKFLQGYRLDLLESYNFDTSLAKSISDQCEILLESLTETNQEGKFFGDWATHNLVYSSELNMILNIDLEGFLTYKPVPEWADFSVVEGWINEVIAQLQSIISEN